MGRQRDGGVSAKWESNDVMIFCDLCLKEIELGNKPTTHFSKDGWTNLMLNFQERTGKMYCRAQMKNKWDQLKKDWRLWRELKHGETCLGWNSTRKTIDASNEWWEKRLKVVPAAKKFRYAGISPELEDKMFMMFSKVRAIGDKALILNSGNMAPESIDERPISDNDNVIEHLSTPVAMNENVGCSLHPTSTQSSKRMKTGKNKVVEKKCVINSTMGEIAETCRIIRHCLMEHCAHQISSCLFTIPETIEELSKHQEILNDYELYDFATMFLREKTNRETFMSLPEDLKVRWIMTRYKNHSE
ncbi:hypothetical protein KSP39_PZI017440 [Platanthera zijinensis]|uniref:Myb/SANT-like domain-containing protein n=1 Tax=Platanthera zijinensis TaxID=2320716 RepID=A0AAP0B5D6_9ASPA